MDRYHIPPDTPVSLGRFDPGDTAGLQEDDTRDRLKDLNRRLENLQELLYAEGKHRLLVVLQAMDTGGKDGVIRHVFEGVNPVGVKVTSFGRPTEMELDHDYLWRVHAHTPGTGQIAIFNRSHYEDVLVVRVQGLVPEEIWGRRYRQINEWERLLVEEGTLIRKFYLHISPEEQAERLQGRLDDPTKRWKFRLGDLDQRARWGDYMAAFEAVLSQTSTPWAPWYVVPADRKWYRNLVVATVLVETLEGLHMDYPPSEDDLSGVVIPPAG
ncbi:MAG TPA: polyphosphate kinase 2 family protein [Acidimicrobiia bacterium]|nr:polyphosphate kinase 2 family protein [Acidimicrobiia bacterium]